MWNFKDNFLLKKAWSYVRTRKILARHDQVSAYWKPILKTYFEGQLNISQVTALKDLPSDKIIWQYWGQGVDSTTLPEVVNICFETVDRYKGEYTVIRLDDKNIYEYLDFPSFVKEKLEKGTFTKTFFSDLLRVALLHCYGGVWLDATVLLTGKIDNTLLDKGYFLYQRDLTVNNKSFWENSYAYYWSWDKRFKVNMLSSIFMSNKNAVVVNTLLDLMLNYWKEEETLNDYFCFQILYDELVSSYLAEEKCKVISDTIPHILQAKFNGVLHDIPYEKVLADSHIHKMSYFDESGLARMKDFITKYQIFA